MHHLPFPTKSKVEKCDILQDQVLLLPLHTSNLSSSSPQKNHQKEEKEPNVDFVGRVGRMGDGQKLGL